MDKDMVHIYNGILLNHKKRWNAAVFNNMDGSWEYRAKLNKSDRKSQEPYDFILMWDIKWKATNEHTHKTNKQTKTHRYRQRYGVYRKEGGGEAVKCKGDEILVTE